MIWTWVGHRTKEKGLHLCKPLIFLVGTRHSIVNLSC